MGLIDYQNKIIYWDEVHWQWLPYVYDNKYMRLPGPGQKKINFSLKTYEKMMGCQYGYTLKNISEIGCAELSKSIFLNLKTGFVKKVSTNDRYVIIKYNGLIYLTVFELGKAVHLDPRKIHRQLKAGRSLPEAMEKAGKIIKDHLGNSYSTMSQMAKHYGLSQVTLYNRLHLLN